MAQMRLVRIEIRELDAVLHMRTTADVLDIHKEVAAWRSDEDFSGTFTSWMEQKGYQVEDVEPEDIIIIRA